LTATDVYSGWVELRPTLNKAHKWVFEALLDVKSSLPFPLAGIDSDDGSEFINSALLKWCRDERIQFTRPLPCRVCVGICGLSSVLSLDCLLR
jgi:hypothetical protein